MMINLIICIATLLTFPTVAWAQVTITDPWAHSTVTEQKVTAAFMSLHTHEDLVLTGASSPAAHKVEVHSMIKEKDIIRMRAIPELLIKSETTTILSPGNYHLMLFGLKQVLIENQTLPLTLTFRKKDGTVIKQTIQANIRKPGTSHSNHH